MFADYAELLIRVALGGLVIAGLWYAASPRPVFSLRIENGCVRTTRGNPPKYFFHKVEDVCHASGIADGMVHGMRWGRKITLRFSGPIPDDCRQKLRNLWQIQGSLR
jgi:hypothetical protein